VEVGDGVPLDLATVAAAAFTFPAHLGSLGMKRKRCPNILLANIYRCPIESGTPTLWRPIRTILLSANDSRIARRNSPGPQ